MPLGKLGKHMLCDLSTQSHLVKSSRVQPFEPPAFLAAHDLTASLHAADGESSGNVHHQEPVAIRVLVDFLCGPKKADVLHVHACRFPNLHEISPNCLDLCKVTTHLVVQQAEPIRNPKHEDAASFGEAIHDVGLHDSLGKVHTTRRLKAIIAHWVLLLLKERGQLISSNQFTS